MIFAALDAVSGAAVALLLLIPVAIILLIAAGITALVFAVRQSQKKKAMQMQNETKVTPQTDQHET